MAFRKFLWLVSIPRVAKASSFGIEVQVPARIDVLVEVEFPGSAHKHEVLAQFWPEHLFERRPVRRHGRSSAFSFDSLWNLLEHFTEQVDGGPGEAHDHHVVEDSEVKSRPAYQDLRHNRGVQEDHEGRRPERMTNYAMRSDLLAVLADFQQYVDCEVRAEHIPLLREEFDNALQREMHVLPLWKVNRVLG